MRTLKLQLEVFNRELEGSNNHPTGNPPGSAPASDTNFENGTMKGIYRKNPDGTYRTHTLYSNPAP